MLQAKRVLSDTNFMHSLAEFDKDNIPEAVIKRLKRYVDDPQYLPETVAKQSRAAMSLCMWTRAMDVYHRCGGDDNGSFKQLELINGPGTCVINGPGTCVINGPGTCVINGPGTCVLGGRPQ